MQKSRTCKWEMLLACAGLLVLPACATSSSGDGSLQNQELRLAALEERVYSGLEKQESLNQQIEMRLTALEAKFPDLKFATGKTVKITPPTQPARPAVKDDEPLAKASMKSPETTTSATSAKLATPAPAATR